MSWNARLEFAPIRTPNGKTLVTLADARAYLLTLPVTDATTAGSTLDEARELAAEALAFHLEGLAEDGEAIPEPSSLEEVMAVKENRDGVAVLIPCPAPAPKSVRINVTIPSDVLDQIDQHAEREGFTRSGFLAQAAKKAMAA